MLIELIEAHTAKLPILSQGTSESHFNDPKSKLIHWDDVNIDNKPAVFTSEKVVFARIKPSKFEKPAIAYPSLLYSTISCQNITTGMLLMLKISLSRVPFDLGFGKIVKNCPVADISPVPPIISLKA